MPFLGTRAPRAFNEPRKAAAEQPGDREIAYRRSWLLERPMPCFHGRYNRILQAVCTVRERTERGKRWMSEHLQDEPLVLAAHEKKKDADERLQMIIPQPNGCGHVHAYADPEESTRDVGYDPAVPILHARLALSKLKAQLRCKRSREETHECAWGPVQESGPPESVWRRKLSKRVHCSAQH